MKDPVLDEFLALTSEDAKAIATQSDCLQLRADPATPATPATPADPATPATPATGNPPRSYRGLLKGCEHYVRDSDGTFVVTRRPIPFEIHFPDDYLRSLDPELQFRVASTSRHIVHPNILGGIVCLGGRFRPGTRLRSLVEHFYGIATGRVVAIGHPFDPMAAEFFLDHMDEVRGLRNEPLWREPLAARVRVETVRNPQPQHTEAS